MAKDKIQRKLVCEKCEKFEIYEEIKYCYDCCEIATERQHKYKTKKITCTTDIDGSNTYRKAMSCLLCGYYKYESIEINEYSKILKQFGGMK